MGCAAHMASSANTRVANADMILAVTAPAFPGPTTDGRVPFALLPEQNTFDFIMTNMMTHVAFMFDRPQIFIFIFQSMQCKTSGTMSAAHDVNGYWHIVWARRNGKG